MNWLPSRVLSQLAGQEATSSGDAVCALTVLPPQEQEFVMLLVFSLCRSGGRHGSAWAGAVGRRGSSSSDGGSGTSSTNGADPDVPLFRREAVLRGERWMAAAKESWG